LVTLQILQDAQRLGLHMYQFGPLRLAQHVELVVQFADLDLRQP